MCWNHTCPSHWESVVHIFLFILTTSTLTWVPYSGGIAQPFAMFPSLLFSSSYKILPGLSSWKSSLSIFLHSFKPPLYLHSLHTKTQMRLGSFPRSLPVSPWLGAELEDWSCFLFHFIHLFMVLVTRHGVIVASCRISPCGMWDLSSSTRNHTCIPELQGGFLTTGPPGRSLEFLSWFCIRAGHLVLWTSAFSVVKLV